MTLESNEPDLLYNLAYECEGHFDQLLETAQKLKPDVGTLEICADFQQRFAIWTSYLGVFARRSQCLDTRLRSLPDLQDLVARLLDILRRSLKYFLAELVTLSDDECLPEASQIQTTSLKTIEDTIARLNRLGITIRQSSRGKVDTRAKKYIADHDMESFACLCVNAVQALYPGASQPLKDYLSESMVRRFARMSRSKLRNENLKVRREVLPTIEEEPSNEAQTNVHMNPSSKKAMNPAISRLRKAPTTPTISDLSSVDPQQVMRRNKQPDEASTKFHKTSSIQVKQGNYPQLPGADEGNNNIFACQWCGEPLIRKELSETNWRQHIDRDLKPYVCLSEQCSDAHPAYPTFKEWYKHMELHDWRWYQKNYLTPGWVCPLCGPSNSAYDSSDALLSHLTESHGGTLSSTSLQAISRQSKVEQPRAWNDCLLCCFTVDDQKSKDESDASKRQIRQQKQETVKSSRKDLETRGPDHPSLDVELSCHSSDSDNAGSQQQRKQRLERSSAVARHIAGHLQVLMLLTLRFAALQSDDSDLKDGDLEGSSVDVDEENSAVLEDSDVGRLSHLSSSVDVAMRDADDEKNEDAAKRDTPFPSTGLSFELMLKEKDDHEAGNNDGAGVDTWMSQVEEEPATNEANSGPEPLDPETALQRASSSQEAASPDKMLDFTHSSNNFLQVPGESGPPLSPSGAPKGTSSMHPPDSARSRDDMEVKYSYYTEDRFFHAIRKKDVATIKSMLADGADLEMMDEFGRTPLWRAVLVGDRSLIQLFLDSGASTEAKNFAGQNILAWALDRGKSDIVDTILGHD